MDVEIIGLPFAGESCVRREQQQCASVALRRPEVDRNLVAVKAALKHLHTTGDLMVASTSTGSNA